MELRKIIVVSTAAIALSTLSFTALYYASASPIPPPIAMDVRGFPSIGQGSIEIVIFEDFLCAHCRLFSREIFPQISERYLETGRARYTIVPLAFLDGSKPIGNAVLSVYEHAPKRFPSFMLELSQTQPTQRNDILLVAQKVGGIDLQRLAQSMDLHLYDSVLDNNLNWAKHLMGYQFRTPALFINGIPTSTASIEAIERRIEKSGRKSPSAPSFTKFLSQKNTRQRYR